uniref:NADH-ubiquinone oxidoreductase chain 2 n=1 Tax=Dixella sp. ZK-2014 TaxID=1543181 RepID=A0A0U1XDP7_9DIPT|nr:NADH dehydrogenase subunit 2 [Dixella sp. ZK-2014]
MFKNSSKLLFFLTLMSGTLITISSNSWLGAWMGLEINLLSFIPLMMDTNNLMSTEASLKYFLTQALASSILLFFIIFMIMNYNLLNTPNLMNYNLLILMALLLKAGAAPFHFWFPGVMEGLSWMNNLILMIWQKLAPMILISYCFNSQIFMIVILTSILIGSLGGLNQTSLRKLMAFSSIGHIGWMLAAILVSDSLFIMYFFMYGLLTFSIVLIFISFKLFHVNQIMSLPMNFIYIKYFLMLNFLSLGGLPPFLGFLPKWLVIQSLVTENYLFLMTAMVVMTMITLYFYIRLCYSTFMLNHSKINWNLKFNYKTSTMMMNLLFSFFSVTGLIFINMFYIFM